VYKQGLHVGALHHIFFEEDGMGETCGMYGEKRNTHVVLLVSLNEGDHLDDRLRWEDNIKVDLQ
jgi:hypothetical protein